MPAVTVIMNCYNGEAYLREALDSVFAQTFTDWELVFWDNCSTDGSAAIAQSYGPKVRYFRGTENVPLGHARRLAMAAARGAWIGFLDTDDLWHPDKLAVQMAALDGTDHVLCYGGIRHITPDGRTLSEVLPRYPSGNQFAGQLNQFDINMVTPLLRRATLEEHGIGFDPAFTASEEYNLFMRLLTKGTVCAVPELIGAWRLSPGSLTDRQIDQLHHERRETLEQIKRDNPGIAERHPASFAEAYARGSYYESRFLMHQGKRAEAVQLLWNERRVHWRYAALAIAAALPGLWRVLHSRTIKVGILPRLIGRAREA